MASASKRFKSLVGGEHRGPATAHTPGNLTSALQDGIHKRLLLRAQYVRANGRLSRQKIPSRLMFLTRAQHLLSSSSQPKQTDSISVEMPKLANLAQRSET